MFFCDVDNPFDSVHSLLFLSVNVFLRKSVLWV